MKKVTIYGASDDLVEVDGCKGADEFGCYSPNSSHVGYFDLISEATMGRMRVHCVYDGCWHFSFGQVEEGDPNPQWGRTTTWEEYTTKHVVEVPDDTVCHPCKEWMKDVEV